MYIWRYPSSLHPKKNKNTEIDYQELCDSHVFCIDSLSLNQVSTTCSKRPNKAQNSDRNLQRETKKVQRHDGNFQSVSTSFYGRNLRCSIWVNGMFRRQGLNVLFLCGRETYVETKNKRKLKQNYKRVAVYFFFTFQDR